MGGGRGLTPLNAIPIFTYSLLSELFTHGDSRLRVGVDTVCGDNGTVYTGDNNLDFSLFISPDTYHLYDVSVVIRHQVLCRSHCTTSGFPEESSVAPCKRHHR